MSKNEADEIERELYIQYKDCFYQIVKAPLLNNTIILLKMLAKHHNMHQMFYLRNLSLSFVFFPS